MASKVTVIVHLVFRFDTGGMENGMVNLINRLPQSQYAHHIVTLDGYNEGFCQRLTSANVTFHELNKKPGQDLGVFKRFNALLKSLKPDVLHTRNIGTIEYQLVGWWRRIPFRVHGEHGWDVNDMGGQNTKYQKLRRVMRRFIHEYVALSCEALDYLLDTIHVARKRIHHICNGVNTDLFVPASGGEHLETDLDKGFFPDDALVIGTVGRLAEVKNQPFLLDAFIALCEQHPEQAHRLRLLIVGDGILMPALKTRVEQAGLQKQVLLAGNRSDVPAMMHCMDVFVLPSLAEGISNTILEAMASGLPVVATRVGGNPDLIAEEFQASHLVDVNNVDQLVTALSPYVTSQSVLAEHKQRARQHCLDHFSINSMVDKYHQLYQFS